MDKKVLNYGAYFTLDNGFSSYTEINEITKEGLENGFLEVNEVIDINWIIEDNEFDNNVCVDSWKIKELPEEEIIELDF